MSVHITKVIVAQNATIGAGVLKDPIRVVLQIYTMDGELAIEIDPCDEDGEPNPRLRIYNHGVAL